MAKKKKGYKCKKCNKEYERKPSGCSECGGISFIEAFIFLDVISDGKLDGDFVDDDEDDDDELEDGED